MNHGNDVAWVSQAYTVIRSPGPVAERPYEDKVRWFAFASGGFLLLSRRFLDVVSGFDLGRPNWCRSRS